MSTAVAGAPGAPGARSAELVAARVPHVRATVVRALKPTSAHAGDTAVVLADGSLEGFVGGVCAETSVRVHALEAIASGRPVLLRIRAGATETVVEEGAVTVANPCLSGGGLDVFLEPHRPLPRLVVVGASPVARSLAELAVPLGLEVERVEAVEAGPALDVAGATAVVVASHGRGEEPALEVALRAGVPYVGLVASRTRGAAVLASLDAADTARVHSPAGLDLGGRTAPQVALSILAELVTTGALAAADPGGADREGTDPAGADARTRPVDAPPTAVDPVCGMTVVVGADTPRLLADGVEHAFCGERCRAAFAAAPERHAAG